MTSTVDIVRWWKEYFQDLLDPADMLTLSGDEGYESPMTVDNEVAKKLSGGLGPGVDEICPEFLKALDAVVVDTPLQHHVESSLWIVRLG